MIYIDQGNGIDVASRIDPSWNVLDVGGWSNPLPRANSVVDILPYETRSQRPGEVFDARSWFTLDFGGSQEYRLPFPDKSFEFSWCQQTLEDIANPFALCREIQRVSLSGFIEIPSREWEATTGVDSEHFTGFCHHRWYGELIPNGGDYIFELTMKSPFTNQYGALLGEPSKRYLGFVWADSFQIREKHLLTKEEIIENVVYFRNVGRYNQIGAYS